MKNLKYLLLCAVILALASCKEQKEQFLPSSALNVVNAILGAGSIKMEKNTGDSAMVNNFKRFVIEAGNSQPRFYPTNAVPTTYFNQSINTEVGGWYSLYFAGVSPNVESIYVKENFIAHKDSVLAVRVANLAPVSFPINVTLTTSTTVNQFTDVAYKQITEFKTYPALRTAVIGSFQFQFRNASTNALLATYNFTASNLSLTRFRNATLVLRGNGGTGTSAYGVIFVPGY